MPAADGQGSLTRDQPRAASGVLLPSPERATGEWSRAGFEVGLARGSCPKARRQPVDAESRIAHNETTFREVNERIEAGRWPTDRDEPVAFRCECGSLRCNAI